MPLTATIAIVVALWALVAVLLVWRAGNAIDPQGRQPPFLRSNSREARKSTGRVSGAGA